MRTIKYLGFSILAPALNMAIDDVFFHKAIEDQDTAIIRFFKFNKACISIGKNQKLDSLPINISNSELEIVRRPTGGGAVIHRDDLCYSIVIPEYYLGKHASLLRSYSLITDGLKSGFQLCGVNVEYGTDDTNKVEPLCFNKALPYELAIHGEKLVGSAQRRAKGILLQQGSIMNKHNIPDDELVIAILNGLKRSLNIEYVYEPLSHEEIFKLTTPQSSKVSL